MSNLLWFCVFVFCCFELLGYCRAEEVVVSHSMAPTINDEREDDDRLTTTFRPVTVNFNDDYDDVTQPQLPKSSKPKPKPKLHSSSSVSFSLLPDHNRLWVCLDFPIINVNFGVIQGKSKKPNNRGSSVIKSKQVIIIF